MDFHWDASADLEDLIYENQEVSASERTHPPASFVAGGIEYSAKECSP